MLKLKIMQMSIVIEITAMISLILMKTMLAKVTATTVIINI